MRTIVNELDFQRKTVVIQWNISKDDLQLFAIKSTKKASDPRHAKEHYQFFVRKKNIKSVKQSKIITQQPKTYEKPNIVDIRSVNTEHLKTSH